MQLTSLRIEKRQLKNFGKILTKRSKVYSSVGVILLDGEVDLVKLALGKLIATHGRRLRQLIGRLTAWNADGDDLFQETLLAIWDKASQYDERGSLQSWLTQIVVNRIKNYYRATNRLRRFIERFAMHRQAMMSKVESGPDDQVDPDLSQALRLLPQTDRSLIVLYYLDEIPAEQIAAAEKISVETLHVRLHRARKRLKQQLEYLARENEYPHAYWRCQVLGKTRMPSNWHANFRRRSFRVVFWNLPTLLSNGGQSNCSKFTTG